MNRPVILIADDEEAICFALARESRRLGVEPLCVADGCGVITHAEVVGLVAAILDVRMRGLDGVSAAVAVRERRSVVTLALMTALESVELAATLSGVCVFRKPFELVTFSDRLANAVTPSRPRVDMGLLPRTAGAA